MTASLLDLLADVLEGARKKGATEADAFVGEEQSFSAQVRIGQVETVKHARDQHLALRVFVGTAAAAASTSDLSRDSLERVVDEAVRSRAVTAPDPLTRAAGGLGLWPAPCPISISTTAAATTSTPEEKIELARRCEQAALAVDPRITNSEGAEYFSTGQRALRLRDVARLRAASYRTSSFSLSRLARGRPRTARCSATPGTHVARTRARARLAGSRSGARRPGARCAGSGARRVKTADVPVIFDPEMAASSGARTSRARRAGPRSTGARSLPARPAGLAIAAPSVTIVDDGTMPGRARLASVRRRGAAHAAHRGGGQGRARVVSARHATAPASSACRPRITPRGTARASRVSTTNLMLLPRAGVARGR